VTFEKEFPGHMAPLDEPAIPTLLVLAIAALGGSLRVSYAAAVRAQWDGSGITIDQDPIGHGWVLRLRGPNARPSADDMEADVMDAEVIQPATLHCHTEDGHEA